MSNKAKQKHKPSKDLSKLSNRLTIAQYNKVSMKDRKQSFSINQPYRIQLPEYFNIPAFKDNEFQMEREEPESPGLMIQQSSILSKKLKDLSVLAEGMKRAKNSKDESRYYFTQAVLLHNNKEYKKAIEYFQKFFKIVHFLQDQKSLELALNAIAIDYMNMKEFQSKPFFILEAIEFHIKQGQISARSDIYVSKINEGICYEMMGKIEEAYSCYQHAHSHVNQDEFREEMVVQLIKRVEQKILAEEAFMTEQFTNSPKKKSRNSSGLFEKSPKKYDSKKLRKAFESASQKVDDYIQNMKGNFVAH